MTADGGRVTVLVLGGTAEARELAARPGRPAGPARGQLAGRPGPRPGAARGRGADRRVRRRGRPGRLAAGTSGSDAVVDATHPFAETISANAAAACAQAGAAAAAPGPARLDARGDGDRWHCGRLAARGRRDAAVARAGGCSSPPAGRGWRPSPALDRLWFLIRCVDPPSGPLPARCAGPAGPRALHGGGGARADAAVTRSTCWSPRTAAAPLTAGKLAAARELRPPGGDGPPRPTAAGAEGAAVRDRRHEAGQLGCSGRPRLHRRVAGRGREHRRWPAVGCAETSGWRWSRR